MLKPHEPRRGKRSGKKAKANRSPEHPGAHATSEERAAKPFQVKLGGKGESKPAASPLGATDSVLLHLWSRLNGGRQLSSLAVVPSHPGGSGMSVARAIIEVGQRQRAAPLRLINAEGLRLGDAAEIIREMNESTASGSIAVVVVDSVLANPVGLEVVLAVQHALLCVDLGTTDLESARRTIERVGRERFVGSVTLRAESSP